MKVKHAVRLPEKERPRARLLIRHPNLDPNDITKAFGLEPSHTWKFGERLIAPNGEPTPAIGRETKWTLVFDNAERKPIREFVAEIIATLPAHNERWAVLLEQGAQASLILAIVGTHHQGSEISASAIAKLAELGMSLGFEIFAVPQN